MFDAEDVLEDALILRASTVAGSIEGDAPSLRVAYIGDDSADFVAEGAEIPESEPELAEVLVHVGKISQLVRVSREQFGREGTAAQLSSSVARALTRRANQAFLNQPAPTAPATNPSTGILNIAGVIEGEEVSGSLDVLVDLCAEIQLNGGQPSHILLSPDAWGQLRKFKTGVDFNSSLIGAGVTDAEPLLLSLPVLVDVAVPSLSGLIIDRRAVVSAVSTINVAVSEEAYFSSDSIGLRAVWSVGQNLVRPDRCASFTVAADGS